MNSARIARWLGVGFALVSATAEGAATTGSVQDFAVIQDGTGWARILFRAGPQVTGLRGTSISHATLTLTTVGIPAAQSLRLRLHPVTTAWSAASVSWTAGWTRAGGDYDDEVYTNAQLDLSQATGTVVFDVTGLLKEVLESGMTADGFLLTVDPADGVGIPVADVTRFGTLSTASFDLRYRKVPPLAIVKER